MEEVTEALVEAASNFLVPLRLAHGYNDEAFLQMCEAVRKAGRAFKHRDSLPKECAMAFVDILAGINNCLALYEGADVDRLHHSIAVLYELFSECTLQE